MGGWKTRANRRRKGASVYYVGKDGVATADCSKLPKEWPVDCLQIRLVYIGYRRPCVFDTGPLFFSGLAERGSLREHVGQEPAFSHGFGRLLPLS